MKAALNFLHPGIPG